MEIMVFTKNFNLTYNTIQYDNSITSSAMRGRLAEMIEAEEQNVRDSIKRFMKSRSM